MNKKVSIKTRSVLRDITTHLDIQHVHSPHPNWQFPLQTKKNKEKSKSCKVTFSTLCFVCYSIKTGMIKVRSWINNFVPISFFPPVSISSGPPDEMSPQEQRDWRGNFRKLNLVIFFYFVDLPESPWNFQMCLIQWKIEICKIYFLFYLTRVGFCLQTSSAKLFEILKKWDLKFKG